MPFSLLRLFVLAFLVYARAAHRIYALKRRRAAEKDSLAHLLTYLRRHSSKLTNYSSRVGFEARHYIRIFKCLLLNLYGECLWLQCASICRECKEGGRSIALDMIVL